MFFQRIAAVKRRRSRDLQGWNKLAEYKQRQIIIPSFIQFDLCQNTQEYLSSLRQQKEHDTTGVMSVLRPIKDTLTIKALPP